MVDSNIDMKFDFLGTKKDNGISTQIKATQGEEDLLLWVLNIVTDGKNTNVEFEATANSQGEEMKITMNVDDVTTKQNVQIVAPEDSNDFQEVIMQVMGAMLGWTQIPGETSLENDQIEVEISQEIAPQTAE